MRALNQLTVMICLAGAACASAPSDGAVTDGIEAIRGFLTDGLEANRDMDIAFARAVPDSAWRWAPNDDVRDFAEQIAHAADNSWLAAGWGGDAPVKVFGDSAVYLNDRDALIAAIANAWDGLLEEVRSLSTEDLMEVRDFWGSPSARWRTYTQGIEHATWTRGQLVPYFHAHGVPVPSVVFY